MSATSVSSDPASTPCRSSDCNRVSAARTATSVSLSAPLVSMSHTLAATTDSPEVSDPFSRKDFKEL